MARYFLDISFDGSGYHGWQRQPGDVSVQEVLEDALAKLTGRPTPLTGAGRTDAGVNARHMPAHFDAEPEIVEAPSFLRGLNALAGKMIAIPSVTRVAEDAHARFDATLRTYRYFASTAKNPFRRHYSWQCSPALDFAAMNEAAAMLPDVSDFASFAKSHSDIKTTLCKVTDAQWFRIEEDLWAFEISADRFLRNMVRSVVGTLVEVGRGKLSLEGFMEVVRSKDRCMAGTSMPACALFLWDVAYPYKVR